MSSISLSVFTCSHSAINWKGAGKHMATLYNNLCLETVNSYCYSTTITITAFAISEILLRHLLIYAISLYKTRGGACDKASIRIKRCWHFKTIMRQASLLTCHILGQYFFFFPCKKNQAVLLPEGNQTASQSKQKVKTKPNSEYRNVNRSVRDCSLVIYQHS